MMSLEPIPAAPFAARATKPHRGAVVLVVVTGAGGRTGSLIFKQLLAQPAQFAPRGVVRSDKSAAALRGAGASDAQLVVGDLLREGEAVLARAMAGADALVISTSAVPKIKPMSMIPVLLAKLTGKQGVRPEFTFKEGQMPEQIDWRVGRAGQGGGARRACGLKKVVLIGSMGGTDRSNASGRLWIGNGNILIWKRKAEKYLINSGLNYTIIHSGHLNDEEGGKRELILDVDDSLIKEGSRYRDIPRADVAAFAVAALTLPQADNRSVDLASKPPGDGAPTTDFAKLLADMPRDCDYSDAAAAQAVAA
eukprot:scaffold9.g3271.t1